MGFPYWYNVKRSIPSSMDYDPPTVLGYNPKTPGVWLVDSLIECTRTVLITISIYWYHFVDDSFLFPSDVSGQITIISEPELREFWGDSLTKPWGDLGWGCPFPSVFDGAWSGRVAISDALRLTELFVLRLVAPWKWVTWVSCFCWLFSC